MLRTKPRVHHEVRSVAIGIRGVALLMAKRIALGLAAIVIAAVAVIFALQLYRHLTGGADDEPGVIFERTDRPSRA